MNTYMKDDLRIRHGRKEDAGELARVERACFPEAEAATEEEMAARLAVFPTFLDSGKGGTHYRVYQWDGNQ